MKRYIYFSAFAAILAACEYTPEETNYREITPPSQFVTAEITLNNVKPEDTISFREETKFTCSLNTEQLTLRQASIELDGKVLRGFFNTEGNTFSFNLSPRNIGYGKHKLKITLITSNGTKSIVDLLGGEGYQFEATWNINAMKPIVPADYFTSGYRLTENGCLEIYWDNSIVSDNDIGKYDFYDRNSQTLSNKQKSKVICDYVCGKRRFKLRTYIEYGPFKYSSYDKTIIVDTPVPKVYIEDLGNNTLRVYWDKPFAFVNAKYKVWYGQKDWEHYEVVKSMGSDTTVVIPKPAAGIDFECRVDFHASTYNNTPIASSYVSFP